MIEIIKNRIWDKMFDVVANRCDYCLHKARYYLFEDIDLLKAKFWNNLALWFNKMEKLILKAHYGEAL